MTKDGKPRPGLEELLKHRCLFITGTDTEIGKTTIAQSIANHWNDQKHEVCAVKAIAAGGKKSRKGNFVSPDSLALSKVCSDKAKKIIQKYSGQPADSPLVGLTQAIAPYTASQLDETPINLNVIRNLIRRIKSVSSQDNMKMIVEGAGGVLVPLAPRRFMVDLIAGLEIPAVVVAGTELGTINHTLMTLEALMRRKVPIGAVILSRRKRGAYKMAEHAAFREIEMFLPGNIPFLFAPYAQNKIPEIKPIPV